MKTTQIRYAATVAATLLLVSSYAQAESNPANGEKLYAESCTRCHDTSIHTRPDRIIFSKSALKKRVMFCESMAGSHWKEQQIQDVVDYLNNTFYKFSE